ncbi:MAG: MBL fold metallo-hydrolase [Acidobacteria bacterium]|nr:MBL fold metallo-hydrolase [Acidobacteriota bacterium]
MKIVVLGSGTSVPHKARNSAGFWVETDGMRLLLDCGAGTLHALPRYEVNWVAVTHIFLSHFHLDHIGELPALHFALKHSPGVQGRTSSLRIVGPVGTAHLLQTWEAALGYELLTLQFPVEIEEVQPGQEYPLLDGHSMRVHPTPHTNESLAVRVEERGTSVGYTGDTAYSEDLSQFFHKTDWLIAECSFAKPRSDVQHMSIPEVAELARRAEVWQLMVTHLYPELDRLDVKGEIAKIFSGPVIIAHDGLSLEI